MILRPNQSLHAGYYNSIKVLQKLELLLGTFTLGSIFEWNEPCRVTH